MGRGVVVIVLVVGFVGAASFLEYRNRRREAELANSVKVAELLPAATRTPDGHAFSPPEGIFTLHFPCAPTQTSQAIEVDGGRVLQFRARCTENDSSFAVMWNARAPAAETTGEALAEELGSKAVLSLKAAPSFSGFELLHGARGTWQGQPSYDALARVDAGGLRLQMAIRAVVLNDNLLLLMSFVPVDEGKQAQRFLDSLEL